MEAKDIISYLGFKEDQFKTIDEFKDAYNKEYVKRSIAVKDDDIVGQVMGRVTGGVVNELKKAAKKLNIEIDKDVFENKKVEDVIKIFGDASEKELEKVRGEYEVKLKSTETDAIKEWKEKHEKLESKYRDTDGLVKTMKDQLAQKDNEFKSKIKTHILKGVREKTFGEIKYASTVDDFKKRGFIATIDDKYELDLDDQENVFAKDKKTGQRIPNPARNGEFLNFEDIVMKEAEEGKLIVKNNAGNGNNTTFVQNNAGNGNQQQNFKVDTGNNQTTLKAVPASQR